MPFSTCTANDTQDGQKINQSMGWEMQANYWLQSPLFHRIGCQCQNVDDVATEKTHVGRDGFQICLDVQNFLPSEISVKTVYNFIEINAKHDEREDEHRYRLPKGFNIADVVCSISSDGILTIQAPRAKSASTESHARQIQIQHTGPARCAVECKCTNVTSS